MSLRPWTCHGKTNQDLVDNLFKAGIIKSQSVKEAFSRVDRKNYSGEPSNSYEDAPQPIGSGQTISAPHMHAYALEEILPTLVSISGTIEEKKRFGSTSYVGDELKILDVGCGSGYLTAVFGRLVDQRGPIKPLSKGRVWGIEVVDELVHKSYQNVNTQDRDLMENRTISISKGDGWTGLPGEGPFHAIHVGAAASIIPTNLMMQLYPEGGLMVIPVGENESVQTLYSVERRRENDVFDKNDFKIKALLGVRYVPLIRPQQP